MKGDFTRETFDPGKHYRRVLMQQGRVQLDADWNEQTEIVLNYLRILTRDVIGPHAGPADDCGFEIVTEETLDRLGSIVADSKRLSYLQDKVANGDFVIGPGRYYVDGIPVENREAILYSEQAGYPFADSPTLTDIPRRSAALVYLDVWERHVTYVEDDHIREVALEGPDTCSRAQVVWQVKVLLEGSRLDPGEGSLNCQSADLLPHLGTGRLQARAYLGKPVTELCAIPPSSRYRGAENQLYRVEIHHGADTAKTATYKWSRENGSVTFPIRRLSGAVAALETLGRDYRLSLKNDDWVEVIDDDYALSGKPGLLAKVAHVYRDDLKVELSVPGPHPPSLPSYEPADSGRHPLLRRWDHPGDPAAAGALPVVEGHDPAGGWEDLEYGVQIRFSPGGRYMIGDYWLIPARVATGDVEWPHEVGDDGQTVLDSDGNPVALARPAAGVYHAYAPLLLLRSAGARRLAGHDCRQQVGPLPTAGYEAAYGSAAIGSHLVAGAGKSGSPARGSRK